jgi:hypothetical protein
MNLEELRVKTENLKTVDPTTLTPTQVMELIEQIASMVDTAEQQLSNVKIEINEK